MGDADRKWSQNKRNEIRKDGVMPSCKDCKYKSYINNRRKNERIYMQSPCFMCKLNLEDNRVVMYEPINQQTSSGKEQAGIMELQKGA